LRTVRAAVVARCESSTLSGEIVNVPASAGDSQQAAADVASTAIDARAITGPAVSS
jgi:hypothetical protein